MIFTTKQTGDKGEAYAAKYLKKHKYKIIARNQQEIKSVRKRPLQCSRNEDLS